MQLRNIRSKSDPYVSKVIIDTHGGLQDVIAIINSIKLAKLHKVQIIGITVTNGRRSVKDAVKDALLAVVLAEAQIPIYQGASQALLLNQTYPKCINFSQDHSILTQLSSKLISQESYRLIQSTPAAKFLAQSSKKYHQQLGILCFGPLTNLALASHLTKQVKSIGVLYVTGGQHSATSNVIGKHSQEGNFSYDPESAYFVLKSFRKNQHHANLYVNPIQTSLTFDFDPYIKSFLSTHSTKLSPSLQQLYSGWVKIHQKYTINSSLLTSILMFNPRALKKFYQVYGEVCVQGKQIKGLLAIDWLRMEVKNGERVENVKIAYEIDTEMIEYSLIQSWGK